jgi:hypothetical protein
VRLQFQMRFIDSNLTAPGELNSPFSPPSAELPDRYAGSARRKAISWNSKDYELLQRN